MPLSAPSLPRAQQSLTYLTPPTATELLPLETVRRRLGLPSDDATLATLAEIITEASDLVAGYLRFRPAYSPAILESVWGLTGCNLYLSARPVLAVSQILDSAGAALEPDNFALDLTANSVRRTATWNTWSQSVPVGHLPLVSGGLEVPAWRIYYSAGWWLESMAVGDPPATPPLGVPPLPAAIRRDFIAICRWLWWRENGAADAGIESMKQEGAELVFREEKADSVDKETGLPFSLTIGMRPYRRV